MLLFVIATMPRAASSMERPVRSANRPTAVRAASRIERDAAGEVRRPAEPPEHDVRVGDGRLLAAARVGGGPGNRACALRSDVGQVAGVDPGDRPAAGADRDEVDGREADGLPELRRVLGHDARLAVADDRDVGRGAADVEADDLVEPLLPCQLLGHDDRRGRAARCRAGRSPRCPRPPWRPPPGRRSRAVPGSEPRDATVIRPPPECMTASRPPKPASPSRRSSADR